MTKKIILILLISICFFGCKDSHSNLKDGLYAEIKTSKGTIIVALEMDKAPITVANFVSLTEGKNTFVNPSYKSKPFFDGLKFHRVIPDFMIQGGDPDGNGSGGTGYEFIDEISDLKFDKAGVLAMANSGPRTNSSQFFITHIATPWLDGKHTIFGHVVENGMEIVNKIVQDDLILNITIIRKGEKAKKFEAIKIFNNYFENESENKKKQELVDAEKKRLFDAKFKTVLDAKMSYFAASKATSSKTQTGLRFKILKKTNGKKPKKGVQVYIHYAGYFENGMLFDSSVEAVAREYGKFDQNRAQQQGYQPIPFESGRKDGLIPGFLEALETMSFGDKIIAFIPSNLGYGEAGYGNGVIPPNSNLVFELELFEELPNKK